MSKDFSVPRLTVPSRCSPQTLFILRSPHEHKCCASFIFKICPCNRDADCHALLTPALARPDENPELFNRPLSEGAYCKPIDCGIKPLKCQRIATLDGSKKPSPTYLIRLKRTTALIHHAAHATHHIGHAAFLAKLFHHFLHLFVLLEQTVHILNFCSRTAGNPAFAGTTN